MKKLLFSLMALFAVIQLNAQTTQGAGVTIDNLTGCHVFVQLNPIASANCNSIPPVTVVVAPHTSYFHPGMAGVHYEVAYVMDNMTLFATIAIPIQTQLNWSGMTSCTGTTLFPVCETQGTDCNGQDITACWDGTPTIPVITITN